jgi:hypothetical protein
VEAIKGSNGLSLLGRTVQIDPMEPKLKPPGTKRLQLQCDIFD